MSIKGKRYGPIKADIVVVGIDVAKRRHVAAIRLPDGSIVKPFSFQNDRSGVQRLVDRAEASLTASGASGVRFALEATGHYGHALQHYLLSAGWPVVGVNPAHTKKVKEVLDGSPEKSDSKDSVLIAELAAQGRCRPVSPAVGAYAELRRLGKLREQLTVERTRYLNRYTGLIDLAFRYNRYRPSPALGGRTPWEVYEAIPPANERHRFEPRAEWPWGSRCASPQLRVRGDRGAELTPMVGFLEGRRHLPVIELQRAA